MKTPGLLMLFAASITLLPVLSVVTLLDPAQAQTATAKTPATKTSTDDRPQPKKPAQECADELFRNREALEASGESPQDFYHRCWWQTDPGQPTPIKSPRKSWEPGQPDGKLKRAAEPKADNKAKGAQIGQKVTEPRKAEAAEPKTIAAPKGPAKTLATKTPATEPPKTGAEPAPQPKAHGEVKAPQGKAVVAEPKVAPEPASDDVERSRIKVAKTPHEKREKPRVVTHERTPRFRDEPQRAVVSREPIRHRRPGFERAYEPAPEIFARPPHRHYPVEAAQPRGPRFVTVGPLPLPRSAPTVCLYATPDAYGNSACVPVR